MPLVSRMVINSGRILAWQFPWGYVGDPLPSPGLASSSVAWAEGGCQGSLGPAVSLQKATGPFGELRAPPPLFLHIPHELSREQGTRKLLLPHLFPFLPPAPGAPCFPGGGGGIVSPTHRAATGMTPLEIQEGAPHLLTTNSQMPSSPRCMDPQRPSQAHVGYWGAGGLGQGNLRSHREGCSPWWAGGTLSLKAPGRSSIWPANPFPRTLWEMGDRVSPLLWSAPGHG